MPLAQIKTAPPAIPEGFSDPVAARVEWTPASGGGTNFRTRRLVAVNRGRFEYRPTRGILLFMGLFFALGFFLSFPGAFGAGDLFSGADGRFGRLILTIVGAAFLAVGLFGLRSVSRTVVVDRVEGISYRAFNGSPVTSKPNIPLDRVHALQIIPERIRDETSTWTSYEINLVLKDGTRHTLVDHARISVLREEAKTLADVLDVPVWDASNPWQMEIYEPEPPEA